MASKKQLSVGRPVVWVGVAVLCASLAAGAWFLKSSGVEKGVKAAQRVATSTVKKHLAPALSAAAVREPLSEADAADVQRIAQTYLDPAKMTMVVVGDKAVITEQLAAYEK